MIGATAKLTDGIYMIDIFVVITLVITQRMYTIIATYIGGMLAK